MDHREEYSLEAKLNVHTHTSFKCSYFAEMQRKGKIGLRLLLDTNDLTWHRADKERVL